MKYLLPFLFAGIAFAHCPEFPLLPECPPPVPPRVPPPTTPDPNPGTSLYLPITDVFQEAVVGAAPFQSSLFPIQFTGDAAAWRSDAKTDSGGNWLSLNPAQGQGDTLVRIAVNPANLRAGTYTGIVTVAAPATLNFSVPIRVTLRIRDLIPSTVRATPSTLSFTGQEGSPSSVAPVRMAIRMEGETSPSWTASAVTLNGGNWLAVSPASGTGNGEVTVRPVLGDLPAGVYAGRVTISAPAAANATLQIPVSLTVERQSVSIAARGIVNAASLRPGPIAPGQLVTIAGERLGPRTGISARFNEATGRFPTSLGGTRVLFDGNPAPLLYVSANQINLQAPFDIAGRPSVKISVEAAGYSASPLVETPVAAAAPGLFTAGESRAVALNQDSSVNSPQNPAAAGEVVQLFLTGQGLTTPRVETGALSPAAAPFATPDASVSVLIDGRPADVLFAGLAPGSIGLLQVNARVPGATPASAVTSIVVTVGGVATERLLFATK